MYSSQGEIGDDYYPFGEVMQHQGSENGYNKFTGKKRDDALGMDHFFARDYLPQTGRFNGSDPIMEYSNPYSYVGNRPLNFVDPLGMQRNNGRRDDSAGPVRFGFLASGGIMGTSYYVDGVEVTGDFFYDAAGVENSSELAYKYSGYYKKISGRSRVQTGDAVVPENDNSDYSYDDNGVWEDYEYWEYVDAGDKLDPFTLNKNIEDMHYPGSDNPKKYNGKPDYSTPPVNISGYPALIHDKKYDKLGAEGANSLFFNTSTITADWEFVAQELLIAYSLRNPNPSVSLTAFKLGIGLGFFATPKTIWFFYNFQKFR